MDKTSGGTWIGEDMTAVFALAEIPDLSIFTVRDLDLLSVQAGRIECRFFVGDERGTRTYRTFFELYKLFQAVPPLSGSGDV